MKYVLLTLLIFSGLPLAGYTQTGEVRNDTIYVLNDVNKPVEFSKAIGKYLYIMDVIPADLPEKSRKLQLISSNSVEIDLKSIEVINNKHLIIPVHLFIEKYYTLYIKKGGATIVTKKIVIR
jgi:hypothetical protein